MQQRGLQGRSMSGGGGGPGGQMPAQQMGRSLSEGGGAGGGGQMGMGGGGGQQMPPGFQAGGGGGGAGGNMAAPDASDKILAMLNRSGGAPGGMMQGGMQQYNGQQMGGNQAEMFDMSNDFPSLGGPSPGMGGGDGMALGQAGGSGSYGAQLARGPAQPDFNIKADDFPSLGGQNEDFPALGGGGPGGGGGGGGPAGQQGDFPALGGSTGRPQQAGQMGQQAQQQAQQAGFQNGQQGQMGNGMQGSQRGGNQRAGRQGQQQQMAQQQQLQAQQQQQMQAQQLQAQRQQQLRQQQAQQQLQQQQQQQAAARQQASSAQQQGPGRPAAAAAAAAQPQPQAQRTATAAQRPASQTPATMAATSNVPPTSRVQAGPDDKYGLLGLLNVIRMTDMDLNHLVLGQDLTSLGLNLNSTECLYATFGSPWGGSELAGNLEPEYVLPACYYERESTFKQAHLARYSLKTLFYMFWQMPRDAMQVHAAKELYKRGWRYHTSQAQWFTQESGQFFVFDTNAWDRIPYPERVDPRQLMASFLQEAELDTALASAEQ